MRAAVVQRYKHRTFHQKPMKWITRERPKIDRIACPWLIKRFIDKKAEIIYVPFDQVQQKASTLHAIPFDIPDVEYTHYKDECTFDYFLKRHNLTDPALRTMAVIVRGADTDRHDLALQSSGLWAISAGLSYNIKDDQQLLASGMLIYDALYSWKNKCNVAVNPRLNMTAFIQWNSLDDLLFGNFRLHWIPRIGTDLYVVYNRGYRKLNELKFRDTEVSAGASKIV